MKTGSANITTPQLPYGGNKSYDKTGANGIRCPTRCCRNCLTAGTSLTTGWTVKIDNFVEVGRNCLTAGTSLTTNRSIIFCSFNSWPQLPYGGNKSYDYKRVKARYNREREAAIALRREQVLRRIVLQV